MNDDQVTFRAYLPPIQSAIKIHGTDGLRIILEVSDSDVAEALKLVMWRERVLRVTIEVDDDA